MKPRSNTQPYPGTQAVSRALNVLKAFTDDVPEWSLTPLAEHLSLNKTTAHRLLRVLEAEGLVVRPNGSERYRLGPEMIALGARAMRANDLRQVVREELESLARATGETATLEVLVGLDVLILDEAHAPRLLGRTGEVGVRWPAHATGTGKVLLAAAGVVLPDTLEACTSSTLTTRRRLEKELKRVAEQGWGGNVEELERGFAAVGAPIRDGEEAVIAALGVGGPVTRMSDGDFKPMVMAVTRAAARVSRRLGSRSGVE